jgi:hypothetical protein
VQQEKVQERMLQLVIIPLVVMAVMAQVVIMELVVFVVRAQEGVPQVA